MKLTIKLLSLAAILIISGLAVPAAAQRIQTVDTDGNPVPYASILTMSGKVIGTTSLEGVLDDVMGADTITVSHVAYKTKKVHIGGKSGRITLEDADFDLPEITVTKKPLVYQQVYYRIISTSDSLGLEYYRAGIMENAYDLETKKLNYEENHVSKAMYGVIKVVLNKVMNIGLKNWAEQHAKDPEQRMKDNNKSIGLKITANGANRKTVSDNYSQVGYIVDDPTTGLRRVVLDGHLMGTHRLQAKGKKKDLEKREKRDAKEKDREQSDYAIYRLNPDGSYSPEDFVMTQTSTSYTKDTSGKNFFILELYTTDRAYVTKAELKQIRKENRMKMTYANIRQFERQHKIQALPAAVQTMLNKFAE